MSESDEPNKEVYVITLHFDPTTFGRLQALRIRHFPPALNYIPAHLTLLHSASFDQIDRLKRSWDRFADRVPLDLHFTGVRSLGRGTAIIVESPGLNAVRAGLLQALSGPFTPQDQQPFKAHVTIQNKVDPAVAKSLFQHLSASFDPWHGSGCGVMIWRYLAGPWQLDSVLPFAGLGRA